MSRVLLIGLGPTTLTALQSLLGRFEVVGVVRADDPDDAVTRLARAAGVKVYADKSARAIDHVVAELQPDCVVVSSYDRILGPTLLARCPFVNVHYAPLPRYRGRATVNWALLNQESHAAISVHELVPQLDGGRILFQQQVPITPADTVATLYERLNAIQLAALAESVERFLAGYPGQEQDHARATYSCTRLPDDGDIDWGQPTARIDALVRALVAPFPGAFTWLNGARLTVWRAVPAPAPVYVGRVPGRVVGLSKSDGWGDVLTGDGVLRLLEVQCDEVIRGASVARLSVDPASLITSVKTTLGLRTVDLIGRINALEARIAELTSMVCSVADGSRFEHMEDKGQ